MSGHPHRTLLVCAVFLSGCQSSGSSFPWHAASGPNDFAPETQRSADDLDPVMAAGTSPIPKAAVPANTDEPVASGRVAQLITDAQRAVRRAGLSDNDPQDLAAARNLYTEVLALDARNGKAHHGLGIVADLEQDWPSAEQHYKQALAQNPRDPSLLNDLGYSYLLQNRDHEASTYLSQAIELEPGHEFARKNLAMLLVRRGDREAARAQLAKLYPPAEAQQLLGRLEAEARGSVSADVATTKRPETPADPGFQAAAQLVEGDRRRAQLEQQPDAAQSLIQPAFNLPWPQTASNQHDPRSGSPSGPPPVSAQPFDSGNVQQQAAQSGGSMPTAAYSQNGMPMSEGPPSVLDNSVHPATMTSSYQDAAPMNPFAGVDPSQNAMIAPRQNPQVSAYPQPAYPQPTMQSGSPGVGRPVGAVVSVAGGTTPGMPSRNPVQPASYPQPTAGMNLQSPATMQNQFYPAPAGQQLSAAVPLIQQGPPQQSQPILPANQAPLAGLNTGPDSLFPISSAASGQTAQWAAPSTVPGQQMPGQQMAGQQMAGQQMAGMQAQAIPAQQSGSVAWQTSPGSAATVNGTASPQHFLPGQPMPGSNAGSGYQAGRQGGFNNQPAVVPGTPRFPSTGFGQPPIASSTGRPISQAGHGSAPGQPSVAAPSPLLAYEQLLQSNDNSYNQSLDEIRDPQAAMHAVPAQY